MAEKFRTYWKGYLRLSLVTIPVRMVTATRSDSQVQFHQIDRKSKQRIRYQKVAPGVGEVDKDDIVRGFEVEPGNYVLLEDEELDAIKIETKHTIELTQFVDACEIDPLYFEKPYYLLPDGEVAEEGYRVIRDALRAKGKAGLGQLTLRGKENLVALHPSGAGMLLETLRYEDEIKEADEVFADIGKGELRSDLVEMAMDLIERKSGPFEPEKYKNHYVGALRQLVEEKIQSGRSVAVGGEEAPAPGTVIDFMEALKRSVAQTGGAAPTEKPKAAPDRAEAPAEPKAAKPKPSSERKPRSASKSQPAAREPAPRDAGKPTRKRKTG